MKKIRLLLLMSSLALLIPLTACDLSIFFKDSSTTETTEPEESNKETEKTKEETETKTDDTDTKQESTEEQSTEKTDSTTSVTDEYDLSVYLDDYHTKYGYLALGDDEEHGELMQSAYGSFYDASKELLLSKEDYSIEKSTTSSGNVNFVSVMQSDFFEDASDLNYYRSAWSVFIAENPIFYFLSNGVLSRSKETTNTKKDSSGKIIEETKVTTYSFILVGYEEYATFEERDKINKKLVALYEDSKDIAALENEALKAKAINDYLKDKLAYAYKIDGVTPEDSYWAHNIIGLLNYNKGVCECYAKGFKLLADQYDVYAISVYGLTNTNEAHAWNYVKVNEAWYGMDVTWNESSNDKYMLCSNATLSADHSPYIKTYGISYQPTPPTLSEVGYTFE